MKMIARLGVMMLLLFPMQSRSQDLPQLNPCGTKFNYYLKTDPQAVVVVGNDGKEVCRWALPSDYHFLGCGELDSGFHVRVFSQKHGQRIVILDDEGRRQREFEVEPLREAAVFKSLDLLVVYGPPLVAEGRALSESFAVAYSLSNGGRVRGDLPYAFGLRGSPRFSARGDSVWLLGSMEEDDGALCLVQYDRNLKEHLRKRIAATGSTAVSVDVAGGRVVGVSRSGRGEGRQYSLFRFLLPNKKLQIIDLDALADTPWVCSVVSEERAIIYSSRRCIGIDIGTMEKRWESTFSEELSQDSTDANESGAVVLRERGRSGAPMKVFVIDAIEGGVVDTIEFQGHGFVKHTDKVDEILFLPAKGGEPSLKRVTSKNAEGEGR